jgi:hypothetical protein
MHRLPIHRTLKHLLANQCKLSGNLAGIDVLYPLYLLTCACINEEDKQFCCPYANRYLLPSECHYDTQSAAMRTLWKNGLRDFHLRFFVLEKRVALFQPLAS